MIIGYENEDVEEIQKLVRKALCPVIIVPSTYKYNHGIRDIVFASDYTERLPIISNWLKLFNNRLNATMHLLRINTPGNFLAGSQSKAIMLKHKIKHNIKNCTINSYSHFNPDEGILEFSNDYNMDLIALVTHSKTALKRWFNTSCTEEVLHKAKYRPIITFNIEMEQQKEFTIKPLPNIKKAVRDKEKK